MNTITNTFQNLDKTQQDRIQKIHSDSNIPIEELIHLESVKILILSLKKDAFKSARDIFDFREIIKLESSELSKLLRFFENSDNLEKLIFFQSLHNKFNISIEDWLELFVTKSAFSDYNFYENFLHFYNKNNRVICEMYDLGIPLMDIVSASPKIESNIYFANVALENFKQLCNNSNLSPLQLLQIDSKKFVYLLAKANELNDKFIDGSVDKKKFDSLLELSLEDLKKTSPYTIKQLNIFVKHKYEKICPSSKIELRKLAYNICPCDIKSAEFYGVIGGKRKPLINLMSAVIKNEIENKSESYEKGELPKLKKLQSLLIFCKDIESVYNRTLFAIKNEDRLPNRVEARKEIATQLLLTKIIELSEIKDLDNTDLFFPGGWLNHSIMYGISIDPSTQKYTFSLWNTGGGLQHHHKHRDKSKLESNLATPISDFNITSDTFKIRAMWSNLTFEQVAAPSFLGALLEENTKYTVSDSNIVYNIIKSHFQKEQDSDNTSGFHHAQEDGNCAWKSIWGASADLLGRDTNPLFAMKIKSAIIETLRQDILECIPQGNRENIDEILITAAKTKESLIKKKIYQ